MQTPQTETLSFCYSGTMRAAAVLVLAARNDREGRSQFGKENPRSEPAKVTKQ